MPQKYQVANRISNRISIFVLKIKLEKPTQTVCLRIVYADKEKLRFLVSA